MSRTLIIGTTKIEKFDSGDGNFIISYRDLEDPKYHYIQQYYNNYLEEESWYYDGQLHRDDGPSRIVEGGVELWYQHGNSHRDDGGPAVIWEDGTQIWMQDGKIHNENGPAIVYPDGRKFYFLHNQPQVNSDNSKECDTDALMLAWMLTGIS